MTKVKRIRRCKICFSPHRGDIEFLIGKGISMYEVSRKYHQEFGIKQESFYTKLRSHLKNNHPPLLLDDPKAPVLPKVEDFNDYAERLLQVGLRPEMLDSKRVSHSAIIQARRTQLEERKVQGMENAQKFMIMKFFRGNVDGQPDGKLKLPGESDKQTDTD